MRARVAFFYFVRLKSIIDKTETNEDNIKIGDLKFPTVKTQRFHYLYSTREFRSGHIVKPL